MSFVYEINGERIEFEKEPTEKDIDEAARATKPKPKTARPQPVEGSGGAAFGVYPQAGRRPESQQDRVASQDMALQTARGVASNVPAVLGIPGTVINTVANLPRTAQDIQNRYQRVVSGSDAPLPELPPYNQVTPYDMGYFGQLTPGPEPTSPAGQLAFAGGQVAGAPIMTRTIQGVAQAPGQVMNTAREMRTGMSEGLRNPTYQSNATTAFQPLEKTYYPTPEVQRFQALPAAQRPAALPALEASQQPSASLFQTPAQMLARNLGPEAAGQTLIPLQGRTARAFGEQIARDVSNRPFTAGGVGLGGAAVGGLFGGPIGAMAGLALAPGMRFAQLAAMNKLSQTAGFAPGFTEQLAAARGRAGIQSGMPTTPALGYTPPGGGGGMPAPGPVNPATMYAGAGGVSADLGTAGAAALNVKYPPMPAVEPPPPQISQTPFDAARAAAERVAPPKTPEQQAILDQIRARAQASGAKYTPPRVDTPTATPVAPAELPPAAAPAPAASTLDQLRSRLTPQTPEQQAAVEAYNALSPAEKAAKTRAENAAKKAPPGTISMIPDDDLIRPVDEGAAGAVAKDVTVMTPEKLQMWRDYKAKITPLMENGEAIGTVRKYPYDIEGKIAVEEVIIPRQYGNTKDVTFTNKDMPNTTYNEFYRQLPDGTYELHDLKITTPDKIISQRFATELVNGVPTRTNQIDVSGGKVGRRGTDSYIDGKYSHSYNGRRSLVDAPQFEKPDITSLTKKIKGE